MTPPTTIRMSPPAGRLERRLELRHQRQVAGGERRDADDVDVASRSPAAPPRPASGTSRRPRRRSRDRRRRRRSPSGRGRGRPGPSWRRGCAGRRPSFRSNAAVMASTRSTASAADLLAVDAGDRRGFGDVAAEAASSASDHLADRRAGPRRVDGGGKQVARRRAPLRASALQRGLDGADVALGAQLRELGELPARTAALSTFSTSISAVSVAAKRLTPTTACSPESMRACVRAAASSMRSFGRPVSIAAPCRRAPRPPRCAAWRARRDRRSAARR